jgi:cytochrome c biogenesis protein CcmG/thiol:disulfide interchange protein DsbE
MLLKRKYLILTGLTFIALLIFGLVIFNPGKKQRIRNGIEKVDRVQEGIYEGETLPDFVLKNLKGKEVNLKRFRGEIVLLNFWAAGCPPCRKEIPSMVQLYERYKDKGLEIIGVNLDRMDKSGVEKFSSEYQITFPILLDPAGKAATLYRITALPTTFILDRDGKIQARVAGGRDWSSGENLKKFETFLNEKE